MKSKLERLHYQADGILETIIKEHRVQENERVEHHHLVDVRLKFQEDDQAAHPLTTSQIKTVLMDIFGAGTETSATTVDWAMVEMLRDPNILKRAQDEVRWVFEGKGFVDEASIDELKYLKSIIKETLRLHPPGTPAPRETHDACQINGYDVPIGTRVIISLWAIGRDPKYWEDAEVFRPERFLDDDRYDYVGSNCEYIPFGAGRRICPGMLFGLKNVEVPLAMFLFHFDWNLVNGNELDMTEVFSVTVRRKDDLFVIPTLQRPILATPWISEFS